MSYLNNPAVVMDNGTGLTKLGFAGNDSPSWIFPTAIATSQGNSTASKKMTSNSTSGSNATGNGNPYFGNSTSATSFNNLNSSMLLSNNLAGKRGTEDLDFYIGNEALIASQGPSYSLSYPIKHGQVENWDHMERFWENSIFKYLRTEPEDHYFLLTEPPLNPPENREQVAEIFFESFNCAGLYIAVQAVLALAASWTSSKVTDRSLTGTVIDSGDGVTHVIPVAEGFVIGSAIKNIPIAGRDITLFIQQLLRERGEADTSLRTAERIKQEHCYVCPDIVKEFNKFDKNPDKFAQFIVENQEKTQKKVVDVGYERFLAPEIFFNPEIASSDFLTPLPTTVDHTIQACPIDVRKALYNNIVLSGGSTMFKDFGRRLQRDIKSIVNNRIAQSELLSGTKSTGVDVSVISHRKQRNAVWFGGSLLAQTAEFKSYCHTKQDYDEYGPEIVRNFSLFNMV
ncbi:similar to Saccharomyces cerevisiae YJR065C ARP3 Essential component of the Arp2/3 complex [Maudiozyma barnettii]|uniref:Actin-related protein 3 n=1 Tax=Maudiozyma barnettii TaxID=61262 RepID=A0A8H2VFM4_9SACH|nr:actin-related protein 3 [Kazachstania barnettii]CAB4254641.1 similar to Saccharomyces cerevisiae YJR065C ARP3 Essential component of the Arp2/3 complex [Kazachstania barnettii]CAD1782683.1 similar to Saccharomyces cerevisiae YJR065C ARP3 Essential component of the Arp2/3 complex [Kazachstania barnettii]